MYLFRLPQGTFRSQRLPLVDIRSGCSVSKTEFFSSLFFKESDANMQEVLGVFQSVACYLQTEFPASPKEERSSFEAFSWKMKTSPISVQTCFVFLAIH